MAGQKRISILTGIIIIVIATIIFLGGAFIYQYFAIKTLPPTNNQISQTSQPVSEGCKLLPYTGNVPLNQLEYYVKGDEDFRGGIISKL